MRSFLRGLLVDACGRVLFAGDRLVDDLLLRLKPVRGLAASAAAVASEIAPTTNPQPDGTLVKALARAWRWQTLLDEGAHTRCEIAEVEGISKSYISRILRLALLAPDIVEAVLERQADQAPIRERLERPVPASWEEQRDKLS